MKKCTSINSRIIKSKKVKVILWVILLSLAFLLIIFKYSFYTKYNRIEQEVERTEDREQEPQDVKTISQQPCAMQSCFNYSRCNLTSNFSIYLYEPDIYNVQSTDRVRNEELLTTVKEMLGKSAYIVNDPKLACIYLVLIGETLLKSISEVQNATDDSIDIEKLYHLPYWNGDGSNHVLLNLGGRDLNSRVINVINHVNTKHAMIAQSTFELQQFRPNFDLVVPPILGTTDGDVWQACAPISPAQREYLLSFQAELRPMNEWILMYPIDDLILKQLIDLSKGKTQDKFLLEFRCVAVTKKQYEDSLLDWTLCGTESSRKSLLEKSTFTLILPPPEKGVSSTFMLARLYEALRSGAIPVILGADEVELPYAKTIDWRRAALLLPKARITELHFLLRSIQHADILAMRRQGRYIWEHYLSSVQATVDTVIASLRERLGIPPHPAPSIVAEIVFNKTFMPLKSNQSLRLQAGAEESLGPIEPPFASPAFKRNYTLSQAHRHAAWNQWMDPFHMYPQTPWEPLFPSEAKFIDAKVNFHPINDGNGSTGKEFSQALGGNYPREQFTIVILTYEREQLLIDLLIDLNGLPFLNKILVVWNSPKPPSDDLRWPNISAPVVVVKASSSSLNNRFRPYDVIETEAVFSMDDDVTLTHEQIIFGFRVWRENRDRLVGFLARHAVWDDGEWHYNTYHQCEQSLVLTGAAFIHKFYMYQYTYRLPQAIRDRVDKYRNCEDIAMGFLISHLTRKPPVKVTSIWLFKILVKKTGLSLRDSFYPQRSECINFLTQVFGYTALLNTQYRADSMSYNSYILSDHDNCFKDV